jgi:hypothetical protein
MKFTNKALSLILVSSFFYSNLSCAAQFGSAFGDVGELAAGGIGTGAPSKDLMYFTIVGTTAVGACATSTTPHFVVNNDDGGKTMVSLLLAAKMSGKKVHVVGRGTCSYIAGHEDVSLIYID